MSERVTILTIAQPFHNELYIFSLSSVVTFWFYGGGGIQNCIMKFTKLTDQIFLSALIGQHTV